MHPNGVLYECVSNAKHEQDRARADNYLVHLGHEAKGMRAIGLGHLRGRLRADERSGPIVLELSRGTVIGV